MQLIYAISDYANANIEKYIKKRKERGLGLVSRKRGDKNIIRELMRITQQKSTK